VSGDPVTDASGRATAIWTLGDEDGLQRLQAEVGDGVRRVVEVLAVEEVRPVVYVANPGGWAGGSGSRLHTVSPDGSGDTQLTMGGFLLDSWPQWSPDGNRVAFFRRFDSWCSSIQGDVMILDVESLKVTRVTDDGPCAVAQGLTWSPDGTRIAMSRNDDIVILDLETGSRTVVVESPEQARLPQWGPLGIAYALRLPPDPARTHLVEPDGSGDRVLMDDEGTSIHPLGWDPEGRRLTAFFNRPGGAPLVRIWDAETGGITTVPKSVGGWWGAWSPDGTEVLVTVGGSAIGVCDDQNRDYIVRVDLETEQAVPVTPQCGTPSGFPTWRPGG
jgi:Tol biopolymer transport system component